MKLLIVLTVAVGAAFALDIPSVGSLLFGGFEDSVAVQITRFAPDTWIQAYVQIPQTTRNCLMKRLLNMIEMISKSQPFNIQSHLAQTQQQCTLGFNKVQPLLDLVVADHHKLSPLVQNIFVQFINDLAQSGINGFRQTSARYQGSWLKATPSDQAQMAGVFTKLTFFFNGPYAQTLTKQAYAVSTCDFLQVPGLLLTLERIGKLAQQTNPAPPQGPYAALHQVVREDFAALRAFAMTSPLKSVLTKQTFTSVAGMLKNLACLDG
jgi:hypothetical protein